MNKTLTLRQIIMTYLLIVISPVLRNIPGITAKRAGSAAYFSVIPATLVTMALVFFINKILQKNKGKNLYDITEASVGRLWAKIIIALYGIWTFISAAAYMQSYVLRFNSTIMPYTDASFFIVVMLVLAFFAFRKNFKTVCRISEICFPVITAILGMLILLAAGVVDRDNLITDQIQTAGSAMAAADFFSVSGYLILTLFFADRLSETSKFRKNAFLGVAFFGLLTAAVTVITIGINGAQLTARLPLPFFTTVKQISSFGVVERVEPLLISVWLLSDFVVISVFTAVFLLCVKWIFGLQKIGFLMIPTLACIYYFTKLFADGQFELEFYTMNIMPWLNIIFQYVIPVVIFVPVLRADASRHISS